MRKNKLSCLSASILLISSLFSGCVNQDYDLGKEIDLTLHVGGNALSAPIGSTDFIKLNKIIKVSDSDLLQLKGGEYTMIKEKSINPVSVSVPKAQSKIVFSPIYIDKDILPAPPASVYNGTIPVTINQTFNTESNGLPSELIELKSISFPIGQQSAITIKMRASGIKSGATLTLNNYKIQFPKFIKSADLDITNGITLGNEILNGSNEITKTVNIDAIDFSYLTNGAQTVSNNKVSINGTINIAGDVACANVGPTTTTAGTPIGLKTDITVDQLEVSKIVGKVNPSIDVNVNPMQFTVPDFLSDDAVSLDILDPMIRITTKNPLNVPIVIKGQLEGWRKGVQKSIVFIEGTMINPIVIDANKTSTIVLSKSGTQGTATDKKYKIEHLSDLLKTIPDEIRFTMTPTSDKSVNHSIELGKDYQLEMNYAMEAPFKFGAGLCVVYNETIDNLNKDIKDIDAKEVSLSTDVENTVPLDLIMSATPVGLDKLPLTGVSVNISGDIKSCDKDGKVQTSQITIEVKENANAVGAIKKLDGILLKVTAKSSQTVYGMSLKEDQYIRLTKIKAKAAGGITVDLNKK